MLLQKINVHETRLILARGLPHNMLMPLDMQVSVKPIQDADFFPVAETFQDTMTTLKDLCLELSKEAVHSILTTANALTVFCHGLHTHQALKIQVILRRHPTPGAVLRGFDMSISSVCWTGTQVLGTNTFAASMDTVHHAQPQSLRKHRLHALIAGLDGIISRKQNCTFTI